jgi:hypothetical protein
MNTNNLVELTGKISSLRDQGTAYQVDFAMIDDSGRLLGIRYDFGTHQVADPIYRSLKNGMKIRITVEGPIEVTRASYRGVGFIMILEK